LLWTVIRQVADDMNEYFDFCHKLSNYIATNIHHAAREERMFVISQTHPLSPLPVHRDPAQRKKW
jgi:hypothetical protein